jgi:hypothetical protein
MPDLSLKFLSPAGYDRSLAETSREAVKRSRELLERTKPLVRESGSLGHPPDKVRVR